MLLIFDLDGTLCVSSAIDNDCYQDACRRVLGIDRIDTDWAHYPDATDPVIGRTLIHRHLPQAACNAELVESTLRQLHDVFVDLIRSRMTPRDSTPAPGVVDLLLEIDERIGTHADANANAAASGNTDALPLHAAVATGGWRPSAELKLRTAGIDLSASVPLRTSSDTPQRVDIIRAAWSAAEQAARTQYPPDAVTYFGDGIWDAAATRQLGINFIGVGVEPGKADRLREHGVATIIQHYPPLRELLDLINTDHHARR
jgi:phosphoglycolate phosphatase-like HAD superfamily hydrolase